MDFEEFIRQDFEHLSKTTELDVSKDSEDAIFMQSVEGHAHNGAGMFHKRRFVNITISDIDPDGRHGGFGGLNPELLARHEHSCCGAVSRYAMNASMAELRLAFEGVGFGNVRTVLASGNVVFDAPSSTVVSLQRKAEAAILKGLGRPFLTFVRSVESIRALFAADPYGAFRLKPGSKRVVTFLRESPRPAPKLPVELHGARVLALSGTEAFTVYVRTPRGPVFMTLIERTLGKDVTTRTWETLEKIAAR
jgi:uncharacterized protein (DUF1697 family)